MTGIVTAYVVFADAAEAERIGRAMVEQGLAACVNILAPCRSIYAWEGSIETAQEVPALFKTAADRVDALVEAVSARHSYAVPAIVIWPIADALPGYAQWVREGSAGSR